MDAERLRAFLLTLPHVVETMQWGNNLVFWIGDKAINGKMFAMVNLDGPVEGKRRPLLLCYPVGLDRYADLLEVDGLYPAPYFARIQWIAVEFWHVFRDPEWEEQMRTAHAIILARISPKTGAILALPAAQQRRLIKENRAVRAEKVEKAAQKKMAANAAKAALRAALKKPLVPRRTARETNGGSPRSRRSPGS